MTSRRTLSPRATRQWSQPSTAAVLSRVSNYMVMDDHDICNNWGDNLEVSSGGYEHMFCMHLIVCTHKVVANLDITFSLGYACLALCTHAHARAPLGLTSACEGSAICRSDVCGGSVVHTAHGVHAVTGRLRDATAEGTAQSFPEQIGRCCTHARTRA